jgi:hypothetical protein
VLKSDSETGLSSFESFAVLKSQHKKNMSGAAIQKLLKDASEEVTTLTQNYASLKAKYEELKKKTEGGSGGKDKDKREKKGEGKRKDDSSEPSGSAKKAKPEEDAPAREKAKPKCTVCKELMAGNDHTKCKKIKAEKKAARAFEREKKLREGGDEGSSSEGSDE